MAFPQTIMGKYGWEKVSTTTQKQKVGTHMQIGEREFVYFSAGETTTAGLLMMQPVAVGAHDLDITTSVNIAAGDTTITLEVPTTDLTANRYKDGWLVFNDRGEEGHMYRIKSNPAHDASADNTVVFTIDEEDGFHQAITLGASNIECGLIANPYASSTIYQHDAIVGAPLGWSVSDIASGSYGWMCVKGPTMALCNGSITIGLPACASNDTLDGAIEALDSDDDAEGTIVGYMGNTVGTAGEYGLIMANIQ
jgi:hypothetical protein